jgi:hypothetical protein
MIFPNAARLARIAASDRRGGAAGRGGASCVDPIG